MVIHKLYVYDHEVYGLGQLLVCRPVVAPMAEGYHTISSVFFLLTLRLLRQKRPVIAIFYCTLQTYIRVAINPSMVTILSMKVYHLSLFHLYICQSVGENLYKWWYRYKWLRQLSKPLCWTNCCKKSNKWRFLRPCDSGALSTLPVTIARFPLWAGSKMSDVFSPPPQKSLPSPFSGRSVWEYN